MNRLPLAYGGVVFDSEGRLLLRQPTHLFDGYAWTFPKGRPEPGESPADTAVREVREETGIKAVIIGRIAGTFHGGSTNNAYFLMRLVEEIGDHDDETSSVCWTSPEEAASCIRMTTNDTGRLRDLEVLKAAVRAASEHGIIRSMGE